MLYQNVSFYAQAPTLGLLLGQKAISRFKHYEKVNDLLKRFFPPVIDPSYFVRSHSFFIDAFRRHRIPRPRFVFEQGTGWHGSEVLAFYLLGAERIVTVDTSRWLRKGSLDQTARTLIQNKNELRPAYQAYLGSEMHVFTARLKALEEMDGDTSQLIERGTVEYVVDKNLTWVPKGFDQFDLVFSNSVLQRLPVSDLKVFLQSKRNVRARHVHRIDCADFQAMRNKRLHKLEYLFVDEKAWNSWTSKYLNYQNRLRSFEFVTLVKDLDYAPAVVDEYVEQKSIDFLRAHANSLSHYGDRDLRDIAITNFTLIAQAAGSGG